MGVEDPHLPSEAGMLASTNVKGMYDKEMFPLTNWEYKQRE